MFLVFLLFDWRGSSNQKGVSWYDAVLATSGVLVLAHVLWNYQTLIRRVGSPTETDVVLGMIYLLLVLEATRRSVGKPLVIIAVVSIAYAYAGPHVPGIFGHRGIAIPRLADHMFMSTEGIFGIPLGASATYIFVFVLFGAFLEVTGVGEVLLDLALARTGGRSGGPAKTAVLASALMGSISGSSMANVVTTGTFTIPLMIKTGYQRYFAGAVEAAASTGGQLMPPVMGAAAFIMIEYTGFSYPQIMLAAVLPAILYFFGVYVSVHLEARRAGLEGIAADELPRFGRVLRQGGHLLVPLFVIVYLLVRGQTPMRAGALGIASLLVVAMASAQTRLNGKKLLQALRSGAVNMASVALACATAGVIAGAITLTGIGLKLASFIELVSQGNLLVALSMTMAASLVLGMGLPTVATYIVLVTIVAPALVNLGVPLLAAHLFVFYYGVVADITPPVALAAYAGAGIAGSNQFKTGVYAAGIAMAGFLIPFTFVFAPPLLLSFENGVWAALAAALPVFLSSLVGVFMMGSAVVGFLRTPSAWYERGILAVGAVLLIQPGFVTDGAGLACLSAVTVLQALRQGKHRKGSG
jgi:TRAP transporter 4TM/12TM fusion protein